MQERYHLAVERPDDRIVIIAEFVNEYHLKRVVRALNGDYAYRLWAADRETVLQAAE
jgi:transposase InsO family protein